MLRPQRIQTGNYHDSAAINNSDHLSEKDMQRVAEFINTQVGIQLPTTKQSLVEGRLRKRIIQLGFDGIHSYLNYVLNSTEGINEQKQLIDVITTNKTSFFRESAHFDYLINTVVAEKLKRIDQQAEKTLQVWSAGCSTGEEAYTLSIVLADAQLRNRGFNYKILATDISPSCLQKASQGIYTEQQISAMPEQLRKKYLLKSRDPDSGLVQMGPEIRRSIHFDYCNLTDRSFAIKQKMDIIFCRNVMIYFDNKVKYALVKKFEQQLAPGGYLFVGHSESLNGLQTGMLQVAPMVYRKDSKK